MSLEPGRIFYGEPAATSPEHALIASFGGLLPRSLCPSDGTCRNEPGACHDHHRAKRCRHSQSGPLKSPPPAVSFPGVLTGMPPTRHRPTSTAGAYCNMATAARQRQGYFGYFWHAITYSKRSVFSNFPGRARTWPTSSAVAVRRDSRHAPKRCRVAGSCAAQRRSARRRTAARHALRPKGKSR